MSKKDIKKYPSIVGQINAKFKDEILWMEVPNFEGRYMVSNMGHVVSMERTCFGVRERRIRERLMKKIMLYRNGKTYLSVNLSNEDGRFGFTISRLVLVVFVGDEPDKVAHFKDGNSENCSLSNLEWSTYSDIAKENASGNYFHREKVSLIDEFRC